MKNLKERLKWWNSSIFGKIDLEMEDNVKVIYDRDATLEGETDDVIQIYLNDRKEAEEALVEFEDKR